MRFENDSAEHPYAQDLDGVWHQRPAGDAWVNSPGEPQCRTRCDKAIYSVHVSEYRPEADDLYAGATLCPCAGLPTADSDSSAGSTP